MVDAIHSVIAQREQLALGQAIPDWLVRLMRLAHVRRSTVITFNYDTLVEHALNGAALYDWNGRAELSYCEAIQDLPPMKGIWGHHGPWPPTVRLLKLHGSLDWYWVPGDLSGATVERTGLVGSWESPADTYPPPPPGKEPHLIPPAAAKSAFYANPLAREMWRQAGRAISSARHLALIGYSLPASDLSAAGLLERHLGDQPCRVAVVNPAPEPVLQRLEPLGVDPTSVDCFTEEDAVARYVSALEAETSQLMVDEILSRPVARTDAPMLIAWSPDHGFAVTAAVKVSPEVVELVADPEHRSLNIATQARYDLETNELPGIGSLLELLTPEVSRVDVRLPDGTSRPLIALDHHVTDFGQSDYWHVFSPV